LDNASGSGTTGLACELNKRKYIMIEKEKKYINVTINRFNMYNIKNNIIL
jgi:site-specific DNA-methyltransferase (adenine-specific)